MKPTSFYLELAARWHVFVMLNIYGWGKIAGGQFIRPGRFPADFIGTPVEQVDGFHLAWTFFGYSSAYIWFIGLSQVLGAWLLLWERTKLLGTAILIPIMLNIVVVDALYSIPEGALANAALYLFLLVLILYFNRSKVRAAWVALTSPTVSPFGSFRELLRDALLIFGLVLLIYMVEQLAVRSLLH